MPSDDEASHWKSAVDPRSGRTYYYHDITRETQWRKPTELASETERRAMEEKEKKQKDFFSAMEANILKSMSQGVVPGTPAATIVPRKKSTIKKGPPITGSKDEDEEDDRPDLIRTISAMDETVLRDIIRRQPSYRNMGSKQTSLNVIDFDTPGDEEDDGGFGSLSKIRGHLSTLQESNREFEMSTATMNFMFDSPKRDSSGGGSTTMDESTISGFGLTNDEDAALRNLASITKEMIEAEEEEDLTSPNGFIGGGGLKQRRGQGTPAFESNKDSKLSRDLPRELDFSDDESDNSSANDQKNDGFMSNKNAATPFAKGKGSSDARALPRELDFSDSDEESEGSLPTPMVKKKESVVNFAESARPKQTERQKKLAETFEVRAPTRRNTCGTLYVGTTMSDPDKDATIKCVCGVYRAHILSSTQSQSFDGEESKYMIFNDLESQQHKSGSARPTYRNPSLEEVTKFYRDVFYKAQMETDCIIMSLIYVERLIKRTNGGLRPRASNWRSLMFSCMILSSKVWDDLSMWNVDFSQSCPPGVSFPLQRINQLELAVLNALSFQVKVPASEYAKYYFLLRSMLIKSGLAGDDMKNMNPLDVNGARRLQQVSAQFESVSLGKSEAHEELKNRSKSLSVADRNRIMNKAAAGPNKVSLEHVVKM